jgi:hypothetical protein
MSENKKFEVGDKVTVKVLRRGKPADERACTVIEVVPAGRMPRRQGFYSRTKWDHQNYIVEDAERVRYRPRVAFVTKVPNLSLEQAKAEIARKAVEQKIEASLEEPITEYIFVVDESGSMHPFVEKMNKLLASQIATLRATAVGKVFVTLWSFGRRAAGFNGFSALARTDDQIKLLADRVPLASLEVPTLGAYGGTPLFYCAEKAIERAATRASARDTAFVLNVLTDGCDEHSPHGSAARLADLVRSTLATDRWTHAFMVPRGYKAILLSRCPSIPEGNVVEWDVTDAGIAEATEVQVNATKSYMASRAAGVTRSSSYFQPDLSKVTETDLAKLDDLSKHFKRYEAVKETTCREIAEERTKEPYVLGSAYYQLTKRETDVQGYKQILIRHRATGRIFGGAEARKLIGLQVGVDAKVEPGNHGDFEIYIESTSYNRILPRGAYMLHDFARKIGAQPTWDHKAAFAAAEAKKQANGVAAPSA